jgi:hypothetical protein
MDKEIKMHAFLCINKIFYNDNKVFYQVINFCFEICLLKPYGLLHTDAQQCKGIKYYQ